MSGLNFYDTVGGRRFIDGTMPKLVQELERYNEDREKEAAKKQYVEIFHAFDAGRGIQNELDKGAEVVQMLNTEKGILVVFKK